MSQFVRMFLATEITCIPQVLDRYIGKYYTNTVSNGATWIFFLWHILHFVFEELINMLLKKMRVKEYIRVRLKQSVWHLGFYGSSFVYCTATLLKNNIDLFSQRKLLAANTSTVPSSLVVGFVVLCTFYGHSIIWESLHKGFSLSSLSYMWLTLFILTTYFTRKVELSLSLLTVISFSHFGIELVRCVSTLLRNDNVFSQFVSKLILGTAVCLFVLTHLIIIPLLFLYPLVYSFVWESKSLAVVMLNSFIWLWLITELMNNPLFKFFVHRIYHNEDTPKTSCPGLVVECALFQPRDDVAYNLKIIRQEIKEREAKMILLRKPKNRNMLVQTLKCMVALKRKLKEKRSSDSSDSEESDGSENEGKDKVERSESDDDSSERDSLLTKAEDNDCLLSQQDTSNLYNADKERYRGDNSKQSEIHM